MALNSALINKVKSFGLRVFMRYPEDDYMLFTTEDGKRIGYLQYTGMEGISLSTIHKPNSITGAGFHMFRHVEEKYLNREDLEACFCMCPDWARGNSVSVKKWKDIDQYRAANSFNKGYLER